MDDPHFAEDYALPKERVAERLDREEEKRIRKIYRGRGCIEEDILFFSPINICDTEWIFIGGARGR